MGEMSVGSLWARVRQWKERGGRHDKQADREPHSENDEHVDRQVCDRKVDLQARGPWFEAQVFAGRLTPVPEGLIESRPNLRRYSRKWPSDEIAIPAGRADLRLSWRKGVAGRHQLG